MKHQNRKVLDTGTSAARDDAEADSDHFNAKKTEQSVGQCILSEGRIRFTPCPQILQVATFSAEYFDLITKSSRHWLPNKRVELDMAKIANKSEEQKDAEAEVKSFEEDLGPFVVAAETTRMAMVFADAKAPNNPIIFANDAFLSLTGCARKEVLGQSFNFLLAHATDVDALAQIEAEFEGNSDAGPEIFYRRKNGTEFCAGLFISPVRGDGGDVVQYFASESVTGAATIDQAVALIDGQVFDAATLDRPSAPAKPTPGEAMAHRLKTPEGKKC